MRTLAHLYRLFPNFGDYYDFPSFLKIGIPSYAKYWLRATNNVRPSHVNIELTNHCNLKCKICNHNVGFKRSMGYMKESVHKAAIDGSSEIPSLAYTGVGEPLLHPRFFELIEYTIKKRPVRCGLSTNALLITEKNAERLINVGFRFIQVSMDGMDEVYENIRGVSFIKFERHLKTLIEAKKATKSKTKIYLSVTVADENVYKQLPEINRRFSSLLDYIWIRPVQTVGMPTEYRRTLPRCLQLFFAPVVFWDGTINACCSDHDNHFNVGQCKETTISEAFNSPLIVKLRRDIFSGTFVPPCDSCGEVLFGNMKYFWS